MIVLTRTWRPRTGAHRMTECTRCGERVGAGQGLTDLLYDRRHHAHNLCRKYGPTTKALMEKL